MSQYVYPLPTTIELPDRTEGPRNPQLTPNLLPSPPEHLELVHILGQVPINLLFIIILSDHHPVHTLFQSCDVLMVWGTFQCTISALLVPEEWEGLGLSSPPCLRSHSMSKGLWRCPVDLHSIVFTQTEGMTLQQGHPAMPPLQEADSPVHQPFHDWKPE